MEVRLSSSTEPAGESSHSAVRHSPAPVWEAAAEIPRSLRIRHEIHDWLEERAVREPSFDETDYRDVRIAMSQATALYDPRSTVDNKKPTDEWQHRYQRLQQRINPEIAETMEGRAQHVQTAELTKLAAAYALSDAWYDDRACAGLDPNRFLFTIQTGWSNPDKDQSMIEDLEDIVMPCQGCPVQAECETYGRQTIGISGKSFNIVLGGKLFGLSDKLKAKVHQLGLARLLVEERPETPQDEVILALVGDNNETAQSANK